MSNCTINSTKSDSVVVNNTQANNVSQKREHSLFKASLFSGLAAGTMATIDDFVFKRNQFKTEVWNHAAEMCNDFSNSAASLYKDIKKPVEFFYDDAKLIAVTGRVAKNTLIAVGVGAVAYFLLKLFTDKSEN